MFLLVYSLTFKAQHNAFDIPKAKQLVSGVRTKEMTKRGYKRKEER